MTLSSWDGKHFNYLKRKSLFKSFNPHFAWCLIGSYCQYCKLVFCSQLFEFIPIDFTHSKGFIGFTPLFLVGQAFWADYKGFSSMLVPSLDIFMAIFWLCLMMGCLLLYWVGLSTWSRMFRYRLDDMLSSHSSELANNGLLWHKHTH